MPDGYTLNDRWASLGALVEGMGHPDGLRLDLGCGYTKAEGFVGLDDESSAKAQTVDQHNAPDVYIDLAHTRIPFADDSCGEVRTSHFLEHVDDVDLVHLFDEMFRLLRPGGTLLIVVPYGRSSDGMVPGHRLYLTEEFFDRNRYFQERFVLTKARWDASPEWHLLPASLRDSLGFELARRTMFNICHQMWLWATPRKGDWTDAPARTASEVAET